MKKHLMSDAGNAVVIAVIAGALGLGGLALMLSQTSNLAQQVGQAEGGAQAGGELNIALQVLQKKFEFRKEPNPNVGSEAEDGADEMDLEIYTGKPEWAPDYSALSDPIDPNNRPFIIPLSPQATTPFVATKLVLGKKDASGICREFYEQGRAIGRAKKTTNDKDCKVVPLRADESGVSALQNRDLLSQTRGIQYGVLGLASLANLSPEEQKNVFNPGFVFPLDKLDSNPVQFLRFITEAANPGVVTGVVVQINNVLAQVPIEPPPPPSQCTIELKNPNSQPLDLSAGNVSVLFDVKTNSIVESASFHLALDEGESLGFYSRDSLAAQFRLDSQSLENFGALRSLKAAGFLLALSNDETDIPSPDTPNEALKRISVTLTGLSSIDTDQMVDGAPRKRNQLTCAAIIRTKKLSPPLCNLTVKNSASVRIIGDVANVGLNCDTLRGGPVTSATIDGRPVTINTTRVFKGTYTRKTNGQAEVITATATGPGGTFTGQVGLGELCPYQDPDFVRQEFVFGQEFKDSIGVDTDRIEKSIADLIFTTGRLDYTSYGTFWSSTSANAGSLYQVATKEDGSWKAAYGWDPAEPCNSSDICMKIVQMSTAKFNNWLAGGKIYWVAVGPRSSGSCSVIRTKMRHAGCFAGSTKLRMADGTEKAVSQIAENEWLYNPHYQAPVRVKGVVKGPENKPLFEVSYGTQKVVVTQDHPFLTRLGWVQAMDLKAGAVLVGAGSGREVKKVRQLAYHKAEDVWNFELDTEDPMGHLVLANEIPTGDLITQQLLKKERHKVP